MWTISVWQRLSFNRDLRSSREQLILQLKEHQRPHPELRQGILQRPILGGGGAIHVVAGKISLTSMSLTLFCSPCPRSCSASRTTFFLIPIRANSQAIGCRISGGSRGTSSPFLPTGASCRNFSFPWNESSHLPHQNASCCVEAVGKMLGSCLESCQKSWEIDERKSQMHAISLRNRSLYKEAQQTSALYMLQQLDAWRKPVVSLGKICEQEKDCFTFARAWLLDKALLLPSMPSAFTASTKSLL